MTQILTLSSHDALLEEPPLNAVTGKVVVVVLWVVGRVGTVNVPTYGLRVNKSIGMRFVPPSQEHSCNRFVRLASFRFPQSKGA